MVMTPIHPISDTTCCYGLQ